MTHPALTLPELLENIFENADRPSNASNVLVCKQWSLICLPVLWYEISGIADFVRLARLLGPMSAVDSDESEDEDHPFQYVSYPGAQDWARFERYAILVREIRLKDLHHGCKQIFATMAEGRRNLNMFPNLHTLEYDMFDSIISPCLLFMHSPVTRIKLVLPREHGFKPHLDSELSSVIEAIPKIGHLQSLEINGSFIILSRDLDRRLGAIKRLQKVQKITLPQYALRTNVFEALAYLPELRELKTQYSTTLHTYNPVDPLPVLPPGSFSTLSCLTLSTDIEKTVQFLNEYTLVSRLNELNIELEDFDSTSLPPLLIAVGKVCRRLRRLSIRKRLLPRDYVEPYPQINILALAPITSFADLTHLELRHPSCLPAITEADLEDFIAQIPHVQSLSLEAGTFHTEKNLTLHALVIIATQCLYLTDLELILNAVDIHTLPLDPPVFRSLQRLKPLESSIKDVHGVAFFLAQVFPRGCVLDAAEGMWGTVANWIPQLVRMRLLTEQRFRG
ncbi:hypothetical protein H0H81_002053 [Sphagnurus paluster]|uniref:F-box domain-containing protein n=1 Tax=Sphagnurus paluster TaxID=117069 RepID=A0A9P7FM94_9AGAR|nr:hypothetical protein H0H81_002053 [Sphagnurus paluster]